MHPTMLVLTPSSPDLALRGSLWLDPLNNVFILCIFRSGALSQLQTFRTLGRTYLITKHMYLDTNSPRSCLHEAFSTSKSCAIGRPPGINIFVSGSGGSHLGRSCFEGNYFMSNRLSISGRLGRRTSLLI